MSRVHDPGNIPEQPAPVSCSLCGLPVGRLQEKGVFNKETLHFCCSGCLQVFQILFNSPEGTHCSYRQTTLYEACVESGLIPRNECDLQKLQNDKSPPASPVLPVDTASSQELKFRIDGMWCTACAWLIEEMLLKTRGVLEAKVFFLTDLVYLRYYPNQVSSEKLFSIVSKLGYKALPLEEDPKKACGNDLLVRLGISSILTFNIMMISAALYFGFFEDIGQNAVAYLSYPLLILSTPVIFYTGFPILKRGWSGVRHLSFSMDSLIAVSSLSAYIYSVVRMLQGSLYVYFDTAAMLITLILLGRFLEAKAREELSSGITQLLGITGSKIRIVNNGKHNWVSSASAHTGTQFLVLTGERIPLDGIVKAGEAMIDQSILTGESRPVRKGSNDRVLAGSLVKNGNLEVTATRVGEDTSLNRMIHLINQALLQKNITEILADRVTRWFIPAIFGLAAATFIALMLRGSAVNEAVLRCLTVLLITCPCALGIATPLAKVASIGKARRHAILIHNAEVLERTKNCDVWLFDKTGTLTEGDFSLQEIVTVDMHENECLKKVASLETHSEHFLAREILRAADGKQFQLEEATHFVSHKGKGVRGRVSGQLIMAGNRALMAAYGLRIPPLLEEKACLNEVQGNTSVFVSLEKDVAGLLIFGDKVRKDSAELVSHLRRNNLPVWLVSGDSEQTTRFISQELNIQSYRAACLPEDKANLVKKLQSEGKVVGMLGDGLNDSAALAQADVGLAFGAGAALPENAADVIMLRSEPSALLFVLSLSRLSSKIISQNLFFAFFYNMIGIPLAMVGLLNPILAVIAMFASSLSVIGNTFRIQTADLNKQ